MVMIKALCLKILSCMVAVVFATALFAADQPAAMLYSHGAAMLNGSTIARSSAIFPVTWYRPIETRLPT